MIRRTTTYTTTVAAAVDSPARHKPKEKETIPSFQTAIKKKG